MNLELISCKDQEGFIEELSTCFYLDTALLKVYYLKHKCGKLFSHIIKHIAVLSSKLEFPLANPLFAFRYWKNLDCSSNYPSWVHTDKNLPSLNTM